MVIGRVLRLHEGAVKSTGSALIRSRKKPAVLHAAAVDEHWLRDAVIQANVASSRSGLAAAERYFFGRAGRFCDNPRLPALMAASAGLAITLAVTSDIAPDPPHHAKIR